MLQNDTISRLFKACAPLVVSLCGLEEAFALIQEASTAAKHAIALNTLITSVDANIGPVSKDECTYSNADKMQLCFSWSLFVVESMVPGFVAQYELTILLSVRLLQRRAGISRLPTELNLPSARDLQLDYIRVCSSALSAEATPESLSMDTQAITLAYDLPQPAEFTPNDSSLPYHLWRKDIKLQLAAMRLSGLTALHYLLRAVCNSVQRELWSVIESPECASQSPPAVLEKVLSTLDNRYGKSWTTSDALERWHSFSQAKGQAIADFLSDFDKEKSFYESVTSRKLEKVDLVAKLLDCVEPSLSLELQKSHGSRIRSLDLEDIKADLLFFERLAKKSVPSSSTSNGNNQVAQQQSSKSSKSSKQDGKKQKKNEKSSQSNEEKKFVPHGKCYRCFSDNHNANRCESGSIADFTLRCAKCGNYHATSACSQNADDLVCGYCSARGHRSSVCTAPRISKTQQNVHLVDTALSPPISTSLAFSPCTIDFFLSGKKLSCLVDTGADVGLIDSSLVSELDKVVRRPIGSVKLSGVATSGINAEEEVLIQVSDGSGQDVILPFLSVTNVRPPVLLGRNCIAMLQAAGMLAISDLLSCNTNHAQGMLKLCSSRYQEPSCPSIVCPAVALDDGQQSVATNFVQSGETSAASLLLWHKDSAALVHDLSDHPVPCADDFVDLQQANSRSKADTGSSVTPLTFPADGNYRLHHSEISAELMVKTVNQLIDDMGEKSIPLQNAPDYELFISRCALGDTLDTPEQCFKFEIDWKMDPADKASWDSSRMVNSLSSAEKTLLDKETEMYCDNHWWEPDAGPRPKGMAEGTIFPIRQPLKSTPIRPVLDFRIPNQASPWASSKPNSTFRCHRQLLSALRPGYAVRQLDLRKAFLKLHIRREVRVRLGSRAFRTKRLCFGLSCGPASLETAISIVLSLVDCGSVVVIRLLDDLLLVGSEPEVASVERALCIVFPLFGFDAPPEKRVTWRSENACEGGSKWLGYLWWWDGSSLKVERPFIDFDVNQVISKRQCFQYAGWLRDGLRYWNDTLARGHADRVRSYSGKFQSWDQELDSKTLKLCRLHLHKAQHYWNIDRRIEVILPWNSENLFVFCDASDGGYGMVFSTTSTIEGPSSVLYAECKVFPKNSWHANRRETFCLAKACQQVLSFVESGFLPSLKKVTISTDSVVAKSTGITRLKPGRGINYVVLRRLQEAVQEIVALLRSSNVDVSIVHISGKLNVYADRLSRLHEDIEQSVQVHLSAISVPDDIESLQKADSLICSVMEKLNAGDQSSFTAAERGLSFGCYLVDGVLKRGCDRGPSGEFYSQLVLPGDHPRIRELVEQCHHELKHAGALAVHNLLRRLVWFPKMRARITRWVRSCPACQISSGGGGHQHPTKRYDQPVSPWMVVGLDLYGPLPCSTSGSRFVLSSTCLLTRYSELVSLPSATAKDVSRGISLAFARWGYPIDLRVHPRTVIHDNGSQLLTDIVQAALQSWGFKSRTIMSRAPWVGGFYEIRHRVITDALRSLSAESSASNWHLDLPLIQLRLNLQPDEDSGLTPHMLVFGFDACFPADCALLTTKPELCDRLGNDELSTEAINDILKSHSDRRRKILDLWTEVWERNRAASAKKRDISVPPSTYHFKQGDWVLIFSPRRTKLDASWRGPFQITNVLGAATFEVDTQDTKIPRTQHQRNLKRWLKEDGSSRDQRVVDDVLCDSDGNSISTELFYGLPNRLFGRLLSSKVLEVFRLVGYNTIEPVIDSIGDPYTVFVEKPLLRLGMLRTRSELKALKEWLCSVDP